MSRDIQEKKKFKEKLKDTYRILIIDVEDLKEVGKYQFTMGKLYTYLLSAILIFSLLLVSLIAFTPLKRLMPGYGDIEENSKFIELRKRLNVLEDELETQIVYTQGLQNMLSGNKTDNIPSAINPSQSGNNVAVTELSEANIKESKITQILDNQYFVTPVSGSISAPFDKAINHLGVDVLAPKGTAIKTISSGVVVGSDFTLETGNTISVQHANDVISVYKHNSALLKKTGDKISAGEAIAIIGNTGTLTDGPHLHFELWHKGNPVNPVNFIDFE